MKIKGIAWAGTKTKKYDETVAFFRNILGLRIRESIADLTVFEFPNGDLFEVIGPGLAPEMEILTGPKVDFFVDDVPATVSELKAKGFKIEGSIYSTPGIQNWANFYSPDGNMYGITDLKTHPLHDQKFDRILFYGPCEENAYLSNWYSCPIYLKGKIWPSTEHYYQAQKMAGTTNEEICRRLGSPREAFEMTRRPDVQIRKDWDEVKINVMNDAIWAKFSQNPELAEQLLATGDFEIAENSPIDYFWGIGQDGSGQNWLGKILMDVRKELRNKSGEV